MENNNHLQTSNQHAEEWQVLFKLVTNGEKLNFYFAGIKRKFA